MASAQQDLTVGNPKKLLITFALPFLISSLLQAFYNITDTWIISHFIGFEAVAATNSGGQIMAVMTNVVLGLSVGGTVLIGQYSGAKEETHLIKTIQSFIGLMTWLGIFFTLIFVLFAKNLLLLIQTPPQVLADAQMFLQVYGVSIFFIFGYNCLASIFRGMGNSKAALYFVLGATALNVILDLLFVAVFSWGISGAAIATTISIAFSFCLALIYFLKKKVLNTFSFALFWPEKFFVLKLLKIGLPSAIQSSVFGLSFLVMTGFINSYGVVAGAVSGIGVKIDSLFLLPINSLASAVSAMCAQNLGARKIHRVESIVKTGLLYNFLMAILFFTIAQCFSKQLFQLFSPDPQVYTLGITYMRFVSINYLLASFLVSFNALAIGAGNTIYPLCVTIMNGFVFRIPLTLFFQHFFGMGLDAVFLGFGLANIGGAISGYIYFRSRFWKRNLL